MVTTRDLAKLYNVETRTLNQSVKRNLERFPDEFCFQMSIVEFNNWKSQIVMTNNLLILSRAKSREEREFYIRMTLKNNYTKVEFR